MLDVPGKEEVDDLASGIFVEIASWLVSDKNCRPRCKRARQRDPLLLATRKLSRIVGAAIGKSDGRKLALGALERIGNTGELERHGDIFNRRHGRDQVKRLKHNPDLPPAKLGERVLTEFSDVFAGDRDRAGVGALETGHHRQQGRLPRARWANQTDGFAAADGQRHVLEDVNARWASAERQVDARERDGGHAVGTGGVVHGIPIVSWFNLRPRGPTRVDSGGIAHIWLVTREVQILTPLRIFVFAAAAFGLVFAASPASAERLLKIVAFGDSLTAGYGVAASDAFPAKLQQALAGKGIKVDIVNAGVSGDTTSGGLARLDWSVPADTDAVILELGANDAMRGIDLAITRKALDEILQRLKQRGIPVLLCGMYAPPNMGEEFVQAYRDMYPALAQRYGAILYPFFLDQVATKPELNQADGIHPNAKGVDRIIEDILPKVEELIAKAKAGS